MTRRAVLIAAIAILSAAAVLLARDLGDILRYGGPPPVPSPTHLVYPHHCYGPLCDDSHTQTGAKLVP